ncbi:MAG: hypothetical protein QGG90_13920, partial [Nitrospinota bacterium]|nr:hypothetical protein [Nitrospinota bacterium]
MAADLVRLRNGLLIHGGHTGIWAALAKGFYGEEDIDCDFQTRGRFRGMWNAAEYDATARSLDELREIAPLNVEMIPRERQR